MQPYRLLPLLTLTASLVACAGAPGTAPGTAPASAITGTLRVPSSIISTNGGGIISTNGGGIVAVGAGHYLLADVQQQPLGGAKVYLADAAGNPIPSLPAVQTDDTGKFTIPNVPSGYTFMVAAEAKTKAGKTATFQTLAKSSELGTTADITPASALVTAEVVQGLKNGDLGSFNPATFRTATDTTDRNLTDDKLPDFTDRANVIAKMDALVASVAELKQTLDQVKQDLEDIKQSLADLRKDIEQQHASPAANPTAAPAGPATSTPAPAATVAAAPPTPTPVPTPVPTATPVDVPEQTPLPVPTACGPAQEHYLQPLIVGITVGAGWTLDVSAGAGTLATGSTDSSGVIRLWAPVGCDLQLSLNALGGARYSGFVRITPGFQDAHATPIKVRFQ